MIMASKKLDSVTGLVLFVFQQQLQEPSMSSRDIF